MDLVLKLREARRMRGLSQKDAARLSGVGEKTISSFETGIRIGSLKLAQLKSLIEVYGLTETEFFGGSIEKAMAPWELDENQIATNCLVDALQTLPKRMQRDLLAKFHLMVETITEVYCGSREEDVPALQPRHAALSSSVPPSYRTARLGANASTAPDRSPRIAG